MPSGINPLPEGQSFQRLEEGEKETPPLQIEGGRRSVSPLSNSDLNAEVERFLQELLETIRKSS
ncbi:MAG: hypothetical protein SNF33_06520 [Candidatus Algichlamydia australiensis]|nr:hypothetical protein [Chlamydiales bacterium]